MEKKKKLSLPVQIFIALVLGIVVGLVFYFTGAAVLESAAGLVEELRLATEEAAGDTPK